MTGGAGFIGSNFVRFAIEAQVAAIEQAIEVLCVDNFTPAEEKMSAIFFQTTVSNWYDTKNEVICGPLVRDI